MTTHVFIVNATTFQLHLEHLFAGTGAGDDCIDFNNSPSTGLHPGKENKLVGMIADAFRIRQGDKIIFYLQQYRGHEGKFFGIFEATENWAFLDNYGAGQYLVQELGKSLTFRTLIKPYKVYPEGVTEWEALDEIESIKSPNLMLWSLIYRKLRGNRGNTMITIYESERLFDLIKKNNKKRKIDVASRKLSFDAGEQKIICLEESVNQYTGRKDEINILPRLIKKYEVWHAFEAHLQAYIVRNIGMGNNKSLDSALIEQGQTIEWIGNEVSCGVGMQRIDVMLALKQSNEKIILPIELKKDNVRPGIVAQLQRYVNWIEQYYLPNTTKGKNYIKPIVICRETNNKTKARYLDALEKFRQFNSKNKDSCKKLTYVEYKLHSNDLLFNVVDY